MNNTYDWASLCISRTASIQDAIKVIDKHVRYQIAIVIDDATRVVGCVTDGDIRRAVMRRVMIDEPVHTIMKVTPVTAPLSMPVVEQDALLNARKLRQLILLHKDGSFAAVRMRAGNENLVRKNAVCLMAGGLGTRLYPLTQDMPKPMIRVGDTPILETIVRNFVQQGFQRFYIAVNYKAEMIKDYFGDGAPWGCEITYLDEEKRLGTAGALSLIKERLEEPLIVKNGDLLSRVNFDNFVDFHAESAAAATMGVREYTVDIPFGVVEMQGHTLTALIEKPKKRFFINAGMYVLDPDVVANIPNDVYYDMTSLFQSLMQDGRTTAGFPVREYWLDIGMHEQLERAQNDYATHFSELALIK